MRINERQLAQVNDRINALVTAGSFYGKKLKEAGITHVADAEEFEKLPFSEKADLREDPEFGRDRQKQICQHRKTDHSAGCDHVIQHP